MRASILVLLYAVTYSGFCFLLDAGGHRPSFGALIDRHYLLQAVLLLPGAFLLWQLHAWIAHRIAGKGNFAETRARIAIAYALPMLLLFVLPELIVYLAAGFDALPRVMRISAPLTFAVRIAAGTLLLRRLQISTARAFAAELAALLIEGLASAPWLR